VLFCVSRPENGRERKAELGSGMGVLMAIFTQTNWRIIKTSSGQFLSVMSELPYLHIKLHSYFPVHLLLRKKKKRGKQRRKKNGICTL
jgi:hypothetical protein